MIILLSNDDGYNANGINVLSKSLDQIARVIFCAPMKNHSGSSSSLSLRKDISVKQIEKDEGIIRKKEESLKTKDNHLLQRELLKEKFVYICDHIESSLCKLEVIDTVFLIVVLLLLIDSRV